MSFVLGLLVIEKVKLELLFFIIIDINVENVFFMVVSVDVEKLICFEF